MIVCSHNIRAAQLDVAPPPMRSVRPAAAGYLGLLVVLMVIMVPVIAVMAYVLLGRSCAT